MARDGGGAGEKGGGAVKTRIEQDARWKAYQHGDARRVQEALKAHRRVLYVLPTGGGKTVIASWLVWQAWLYGSRVLVLVHRGELLEQMFATMTRGASLRPEDVGVIWRDDKRTNPDARIQIASIDTAIRRKKFPAADFVLADEAHHGVSDKWQRVFGWYPEAKILGLTATPTRLDGKPLGEAFDAMVEGPTIAKLIEGKWLMRPRVFVRDRGRSIDLTKVKRQAGDYERGELERRASRRNVLSGVSEHIKKHAENRNGIVFACGLKHCVKLASTLRGAGMKAEIVTGETSTADRRKLLDPGGWLDSGSRRYVVTCDVLSEGYDLPSIKLVVMVRPTCSEALYLHQSGRILRPHKSGVEPMILDLTTNALRWGVPQDVREWSLHEKRRVPGKGDPPRAKCCPECEAVLPVSASTCECGYAFPIREPAEREGQLVEIDPEAWVREKLAIAKTIPSIKDPERFVREYVTQVMRVTP